MKTLLIVDDDQNQLRLYKKEFESDGYRVIVAASGREGLQKFDEYRPDLVVLDIRMPDIDGLEVLAKMLSKQNRMPIIIHTAYFSYQDNYMSWAADAYIIKSSDLSELKNKVRQLLGDCFNEGIISKAPAAASQ